MTAAPPHTSGCPARAVVALAVGLLGAGCASSDALPADDTSGVTASLVTDPTTEPSSSSTTTPQTQAAATTTPSTTEASTTAPASTALPPPSPSGTPTIETGLVTDRTILVGGVERRYHIFVPDEPAGAPVVLLFHGNGGDPNQLIGLDGTPAPYRVWLDIAARDGLIVVAPAGISTAPGQQGWNDCRTDAPTNSTADDVAFVSALIDSIVGEFGADANRVHATGTSNGGHMSIRIAEELPEKITSFAAVVAANAVNSACDISDVPVSAMFINGTADRLLPYTGGAMINGAEVFSVEETVAAWVARNGAEPAGTVQQRPDLDPRDGSTVITRIHRGGIDDTSVALFTIEGGGHVEPSIAERLRGPVLDAIGPQNGDIEMAEEVWAFFSGTL